MILKKRKHLFWSTVTSPEVSSWFPRQAWVGLQLPRLAAKQEANLVSLCVSGARQGLGRTGEERTGRLSVMAEGTFAVLAAGGKVLTPSFLQTQPLCS